MASPLIACAALVSLIASSALAEDLQASAAAGAVAPRLAKSAFFDALAPVDMLGLGAVRAGEDIYAATSDQRLTATNSGNSITAASVQSGDVNLQAGVFDGFSGLGNFVINTGNNNNLQGSLSVTILMAPVTALATH